MPESEGHRFTVPFAFSETATVPTTFDERCRDCPRLAAHLDEVRRQHPHYFCRPVPPFGVARPRLLIVGLAPGLHGANRTGRPFSGDYAGELLYATLHRFGFASHASPVRADGTLNEAMRLDGCRITNAVKCLPPQNVPKNAEIKTCNRYLHAEIAGLPTGTVLLALGKVAHDAVLRATGRKLSAHPFGHGKRHAFDNDGKRHVLFDSYHCSRYNTNTGVLTEERFHDVFRYIARELA